MTLRFTSLQDLQDKLPSGIKATWVNGKIHYTVRSSKNGRKVSLGTYLCPDLAMQALAKFKAGLPLALTPEEVQAVASAEADKQARLQRDTLEKDASKLTEPQMFALLAAQPPHLLDSTKPFKTFDEAGRLVTIPASVVNAYFDALFYLEDTPEENISEQNPDQLPIDSSLFGYQGFDATEDKDGSI